MTQDDTGVNDMGNPYKAKTRRATPTPARDEIPSGTIGQLIAWVGEDKDRARKVLAQESTEDKPRKSLTAQLEEIIDA